MYDIAGKDKERMLRQDSEGDEVEARDKFQKKSRVNRLD